MILRPRIRHRILKRDGYKCTECGNTQKLEVHHKWPRRQGGSDSEKNLVTVCRLCHRKKESFIDRIRRRWKKTKVTDELGTRIYKHEINQETNRPQKK